MQIITVSEYLRTRLSELGIKDIIGVAGDYNFDFVEQIEHDDRFQWRRDCNQLCASYAVDDYAKTHGISEEINQNADKLCMIEIIMDKYKQPELLQRLTSLSQKI
ncbi:thiamine pyrophosphate-binding protein [Francisella tularensis]|uniref:thiamine pyrophosphate-binding protein n=1 Tax=Francisella tularensis TaxID=263 RepID=UPI001F3C4394|nr:thiamine pyrophosphate-binding protein [Francisella tularensis]